MKIQLYALFIALIVLLFALKDAHAGPTIVGNGDDGKDLEKTQLVQSGILLSTRDKAIDHVNKMNVRAIRGLGSLAAELKNAEIYLVESNTRPDEKNDGGMEVSQDKKYVYARTFARPNSPVRFFPAALLMSEEQLIKLHIHEALHRALPEKIRENESAVSEITLAIASPNSNFDTIESTVNKYLSAESVNVSGAGLGANTESELVVRPTEKLKRPSLVQYSYTGFELKEADRNLYPIVGMHRFDSLLHPFGGKTNAFGLGITMSYLNMENHSLMGPLQLSARYLLSTWREFDIELFVDHSMYSLANEELKNVENARDVTTIGISMRRDAPRFYSENFISHTMEGEKDFRIGKVGYTKSFASIVTARFSVGAKLGNFSIGGKGDFILTESAVTRSKTGSFDNSAERERVRMVKFGPELGYRKGNLQFSAFVQSVIDGTPGYNLTATAHLMGHGAGQSFAGTSLALVF